MRSRAALRVMVLLWTRRASVSWVPIFMKGFSEVMGSWKMKLMRPPRRLRRVFSSASRMDVPSKVMRESCP